MKCIISIGIMLLFCLGLSAQSYPTVFVKISSTPGGLSAPITNSAVFGIQSAAIGDLDNDGIQELLVGK